MQQEMSHRKTKVVQQIHDYNITHLKPWIRIPAVNLTRKYKATGERVRTQRQLPTYADQPKGLHRWAIDPDICIFELN